ncbi:unnamed protein product [Caenorhabditis brenneri]
MYRVIDKSNTYMLTRDEGEANFPEDFLQWTSTDCIATKDSRIGSTSKTQGSQMTSSAVKINSLQRNTKTTRIPHVYITAEEFNNKLNHPILFNLNTASVAENIKNWLYFNNMTQEHFARHILDLSKKSAWKYFNYPVEWDKMRTGRWVFTRMYNFLNMSPEMQAAVFKIDLYKKKTTHAPLKP